MENIYDMSMLEVRDLLVTQLDEWYSCQPFEIIHKIFNIDYLYDLSNEELEEELDFLRADWNDMSIDDRIEVYELLN